MKRLPYFEGHLKNETQNFVVGGGAHLLMRYTTN